MPSTTNFGVNYTVLEEKWLSFTSESGTVSQTVEVAGAFVEQFIYAMLGYSSIQGTSIRRYTPQKHPAFDKLYATAIEFAGPLGTASAGDSANNYHYFGNEKLIVTYNTLDFQVREDSEVGSELYRYTFKQEQFNVESILVPSKGFVFVDVGPTYTERIPNENTTMLLASGEVTITWYQIPSEVNTNGEESFPAQLRANISNTVGKVNSAAFLVTYAAQTLLCLPPEIVPIRQPDLSRAYRITYKFGYRPNTWNKLWRPTTNAFDDVVRTTDPNTGIYETADFLNLFSLAAP